MLSVGKMERGVVRVLVDGVDGNAAEDSDAGGGGELFGGDLVKAVGGDADVGRGGSRCGDRARCGGADGPTVPAVGDGVVERGFVKLPVAPGAVAGEFGAGVDEDDFGRIGERGQTDGEADGGEAGAGEGEVVGGAAGLGGGLVGFDAGDGAATGGCHRCTPTRPSRWW